jgi:hypothetical protein
MKCFPCLLSLILVLVQLTSLRSQESYPRPPQEAAGVTEDSRNDAIKSLFAHLKPTGRNSALMLGFDTDESSDAESYAQYYDDFEKLSEKKPTNQSLLFVRNDRSLELAARFDFIASPQSNGWLFLGQARYFERKPRDKNEHLDRLEKEGSLKNFAFDYSRIWTAKDLDRIGPARKAVIGRTKAQIDREYRRLPRDEREYHRNISDYEKIGWISDGYYIADGYWSLIHGGAAWFEAREESRLVHLGKQKLSGELHKWYSKKTILDQYKSTFDTTRRNGPDAKYNNMDATWERWSVLIGGKSGDRIPTFTIERHEGQTRLIGRVLVDGNTHRSFLLEEDFGLAPKPLARYDNPVFDFSRAKAIFGDLIDVFVSPGQETVFFLTAAELIGFDVASGDELLRTRHGLKFNKVVMVEWADSRQAEKWRAELSNLQTRRK